jgi:hypothetical protein
MPRKREDGDNSGVPSVLPVNGDSLELKAQLNDLNRKFDKLMDKIAFLETRPTGDGEEPKSNDGRLDLTYKDRARRESDHLARASFISEGIRDKRMAEGYQSAAVGVVREHQDFYKMVTLGIMDLASHTDNLKKLAQERDRLGRHRLEKLIVSLSLIAAATVVGVSILQPQDMQIIADSLSNDRNLYIFIGLTLLVIGVIVFDLWRRRKSRAV